MADCPKAIGRPRWCACHGWEHETTKQHKCDWGPWHPWCSTYRCIHPGCHKNMPSAEVARRLNEYETPNNINADLLKVLEALVARCCLNDRFPELTKPAFEEIRKAKEKQKGKS